MRDAAAFPSRPIRFIAPTSAGGGNDIIARLLSAHLTSAWGQQVIVDLRPGAGGIVGSEITARAAPDGYTIAIVGTGHALNPSLYAKLPYDTLRDFAPVTMVAFAPLVFVVHPSVPAHSVKELIALARARRGELNYASAGLGTAGWLSVERFKRLAGVDMVHVPYKGAGDAVASVISGQVQLLSTGPTAVVAHINSGKLRALGVTSAKRMSLFPELPAIAESLPGYEEQIFVAIVAPAKTPRPIVSKYHAEIARIVALPEVRARMDSLGLVAVAWAPERLSAYLGTEIGKWSRVFEELRIKPESW